MDDKELEKKIKDFLVKSTEGSEELKDQVWHNIQNNIYGGVRGMTRMDRKRKSKKTARAVIGLASAAAVAFGVFAFGTEPGQAAVQKIWELLAPQKTITQELEGNKEDADFSLHVRDGKGSDQETVENPTEKGAVGYTIYIDEERYKMEKGDQVDRVVLKEALDERYPEVYMEIRQMEDRTVEEMIAEIKGRLEEEYDYINEVGEVDFPIDSYLITARAGSDWNSEYVKYYFVDNGQGGCFVIKQKMFMEAAEGHGARFDYMLKEFKVISLPE